MPKPAFKLGLLSAHQQNIIIMPFHWWAGEGANLIRSFLCDGTLHL